MSEFKCNENCAECCGIIPFPKELIDKYKDFDFGSMKVEIKRDERDNYYFITEDLLCIFLDRKTKKCKIYEDRPWICRAYGIHVPCPYIKPNGNPRSEAQRKHVQRKINHQVTKKFKIR